MNLEHYLLYAAYVLALFFVYFSIIEWAVHRYPMHQRSFKDIPVLGFFFKTHIQHHQEYTAAHYQCDDDYGHLHGEIMLPLWAGLLLAFGATMPILILEHYIGYQWHLSFICFVLAYVYYWNFEFVHVAMHEADTWQRSFYSKLGIFEYLQEHHRVHHSHWGCNFNLLCPVADKIFGTMKKN